MGETKLTDDIRNIVRTASGWQSFGEPNSMRWIAAYEQALTAAETALAEERAKREEAEREASSQMEGHQSMHAAWCKAQEERDEAYRRTEAAGHELDRVLTEANRVAKERDAERARADRAEAELRRVYLAVRNQDVRNQPADMRDLSRIVIDEVGELRRWVDEAEQKAARQLAAANESDARLCEAEKKIDRAEAAMERMRDSLRASEKRELTALAELEKGESK